MEHHKTIMCQELRGNKGFIFYTNVSSLLDFVRALANPFIISLCSQTAHLRFEDLFNDEIINMFENGEKVQREGLFLRQRSLQ